MSEFIPWKPASGHFVDECIINLMKPMDKNTYQIGLTRLSHMNRRHRIKENGQNKGNKPPPPINQ